MSSRPSKPGEWWLIVSFSCVLIAPVLIGITFESGKEVAAMKKLGVVAEAEVMSRRTEEHTHNRKKGRTSSTTSYLLTLSYDLMSKNTFSAWNESGAYTPSKYPAKASGEFEVTQAQYDALPEGTKTMAAHIPDQYKSLNLAEEMKWQASGVQSMIQYAISGVLLLIAVWSGRRGWKARKAAKAAQ